MQKLKQSDCKASNRLLIFCEAAKRPPKISLSLIRLPQVHPERSLNLSIHRYIFIYICVFTTTTNFCKQTSNKCQISFKKSQLLLVWSQNNLVLQKQFILSSYRCIVTQNQTNKKLFAEFATFAASDSKFLRLFGQIQFNEFVVQQSFFYHSKNGSTQRTAQTFSRQLLTTLRTVTCHFGASQGYKSSLCKLPKTAEKGRPHSSHPFPEWSVCLYGNRHCLQKCVVSRHKLSN